ncbi:MAG: SUMF1/EgtB/PvdO family nonheme iron enzyme [Myxococcota bacterium]|nr:SUMF1/EgtB/PvdO family nonheme iron enzyme [Myxococcota bacterium]
MSRQENQGHRLLSLATLVLLVACGAPQPVPNEQTPVRALQTQLFEAPSAHFVALRSSTLRLELQRKLREPAVARRALRQLSGHRGRMLGLRLERGERRWLALLALELEGGGQRSLSEGLRFMLRGSQRRLSLQWKKLPQGQRLRGAEGRQWRVALREAEVSENLVLRNQYAECVNEGVCTSPPRQPAGGGDAQHPVCVTRQQAARFATWVGGDLMSASEALWLDEQSERLQIERSLPEWVLDTHLNPPNGSPQESGAAAWALWWQREFEDEPRCKGGRCVGEEAVISEGKKLSARAASSCAYFRLLKRPLRALARRAHRESALLEWAKLVDPQEALTGREARLRLESYETFREQMGRHTLGSEPLNDELLWSFAELQDFPAQLEESKSGLFWQLIRGGSATFENPIRPLRIPSYYLSKSEVTVGQYRRCVDAKACPAPKPCEGGAWTRRPEGREDLPISCVTWSEARAFARWVGGELPSESQWVWAARGPASRRYPWGAEPLSCERVRSRSLERRCPESADCPLKPVCSFPAGHSPEGLCDLAGSLRELLLDQFSVSGESPLNGGARCDMADCGPETAHSTRGQSDCLPSGYALDHRGASVAGERSGDLGFRVARTTR